MFYDTLSRSEYKYIDRYTEIRKNSIEIVMLFMLRLQLFS